MRLYNTEGAIQVDDPEYGIFKPDANGAFDGLPDAMYAKLHGRPGWEDEAERVARITAEQLEKMRDPATMLAELQKMSAGQGAVATLLAQALGLAPVAESETSAGPAESGSEVPVEKVPVEKVSAEAAKTTTTRGRSSKAAKAEASDAS